MKLWIVILLALLGAPPVTSAQVSQQPIVVRSTAPSGACSVVAPLVMVTGVGTYQCIHGAWSMLSVAADTGTVTEVDGGSPLFTIATPNTTPTLIQSEAGADTVYGDCTALGGAPSFCEITAGMLIDALGSGEVPAVAIGGAPPLTTSMQTGTGPIVLASAPTLVGGDAAPVTITSPDVNGAALSLVSPTGASGSIYSSYKLEATGTGDPVLTNLRGLATYDARNNVWPMFLNGNATYPVLLFTSGGGIGWVNSPTDARGTGLPVESYDTSVGRAAAGVVCATAGIAPTACNGTFQAVAFTDTGLLNAATVGTDATGKLVPGAVSGPVAATLHIAAGAGTGASVVCTTNYACNASYGSVTISGGTAMHNEGIQFTLTPAVAWAAWPSCSWQPADINTSTSVDSVGMGFYAQATSTTSAGFGLSSAPSLGGTTTYNYHCN